MMSFDCFQRKMKRTVSIDWICPNTLLETWFFPRLKKTSTQMESFNWNKSQNIWWTEKPHKKKREMLRSNLSEVKVVLDFNASAITVAPSSEIWLSWRLERISVKKWTTKNSINNTAQRHIKIKTTKRKREMWIWYYSSEVKVALDFNAPAIALAPSSVILLFRSLYRSKMNLQRISWVLLM